MTDKLERLARIEAEAAVGRVDGEDIYKITITDGVPSIEKVG